MGHQEWTPGSQIGADMNAWSPDSRDGVLMSQKELWSTNQTSGNGNNDNKNAKDRLGVMTLIAIM